MTRDEIVREMAIATKETEEWSNFWSLQEMEALLRASLARAKECGWELVDTENDWGFMASIMKWPPEKRTSFYRAAEELTKIFDAGRKP